MMIEKRKKRGERERGSEPRMIALDIASQATKEGKVAVASTTTVKPRRTRSHSISLGIVFFGKMKL